MKTDNEKLAETIKDIKCCMLTTIGEQGQLHSRPMATLGLGDSDEFDGELWFFTRNDSLKAHDISEDKEVSLSYVHPTHQRYIAISGVASLEKNKNKMNDLWNPTLSTWFPEGLEDPQLALIRVSVVSSEIWEAPGAVIKPFNQSGEHRQLGKTH